MSVIGQMKKTAAVLALLAGGLPLGASAASMNLIENGDFEAGNTGFTSDFLFSPGNIQTGASTYDIVTSAADSHNIATDYGDNTTGSGLYYAANGSTSTDTVAWSQTIAVAPSTDYTFSFFLSSWFASAPSALRLTVDGQDVGSANASLTPGVWEANSFEFTTDAMTTQIVLSLINTSTGFIGNDFGLDDLSLMADMDQAPVPVPGAIPLMLSGLAGFGWLRKQQKSA